MNSDVRAARLCILSGVFGRLDPEAAGVFHPDFCSKFVGGEAKRGSLF